MKKIIVLFFSLHFFLIAQQELKIISVSPTGSTVTVDQSQMISVTFSEAMTALQEISADLSNAPMIITPKLKGKFRWQGTSTLSFIPERNLPRATAFEVTVPAGTKSVSGKVLKETFEWRFITPVPTIISTNPSHAEHNIELDHSITLTFNQKVRPVEVSKFISVEEQSSAGISSYPKFKTIIGTAKETTSVTIRSEKPFSAGSQMYVRVKPGIKGIEGDLKMSNEYSFSFWTYSSFKFVAVMNEYGFDPEQSLRLKFTTPVSEEELLTHLSFQPTIELNTRENYSSYYSEEKYVTVPLKPATHYKGFILPGMKDQFGQVLKDTARFEFTTRPSTPVLYMATGMGILEAYESHRYPLAVLNVNKFRVQMGKVKPDKVIEALRGFNFSRGWEYDWYYSRDNFFNGDVGGTNIFQFDQTITPKLEPNVSKLIPVNLDTVLGKSKLGVTFLQATYEKQYNKAVIQVTNLGITAKFSPDDNLVWITKLQDASPVPNADVEIRSDSNRVLWKGKTDKQGLVKGPGYGKLGLEQHQANDNSEEEEEYYYGSRAPRLWVFAKSGDDFAFTNSDLDNGIEPWSYGISYEWNPQYEKAEGTIFSDRGLYKAGERVDLKAVVRVRREGAWRVPKKDTVKIIVKDERDEEILSKEYPLSMFGSCAVSLTLSGSAPLGYYSVRLQLKKHINGKIVWSNLEYSSFRVEAFRPAEFDVTAMMDQKSYVIGDSVSGILSAKYLYGAPLKNANVQWRIAITGDSYSPPGFDGYYFEPLYWLSKYSNSEYRELENNSETLDEQGVIRVKSKLNVGEISRTVRLTLEGDVTSTSRHVISGRASVIVHGGEYYIGIGQSSTFVQADSNLTQKFAAVDPDGKFIPGNSISLKTYKRIWHSVRKAEVGGRYYWTSEVENILVDTATILSGDKAIERKYKPTEPGFYYSEISSTDRRGNELAASSYFYVSGAGYVPWERSNDDRIELIVDKQHFTPGDVAHIIIKNPYEEAIALVSLEREGILSHFTTKVKGSAPQIDIPIKSEHLPNIFVSVVLLQGRIDSIAITRDADIGRPSFKMGYANLSVSPLEKKIAVKIETDKNDYRPGDSVRVTINTLLQNGKGISSEVALSVADLGVLNLINYHLPELFNQYYAERALSVTTTETRAHLIEQRSYDEKGEVIGGGGAEKSMATMDAEGIRKDFRASAYWNPSIITDAKGKAVIAFKLPDNLTAFKLMAVAHSLESDFGYGENSITVSKPLLLQPSLPRFARVGDEFEGGVVVMNYSDKAKRVKLITKVEGIISTSPETTFVTLQMGESKEMRSKLKAEKIGTAKFVFRAYTEEDYDGMQWTIPIQVPRLREAVATSSTLTEQSVKEKVIKPKNIYEELGSVDVSVSSTAMVGLEESVRYLFDYPYGCLEQKMSRALPIILAADMVKSFNIEIMKGNDYRKIVQDVLDEVPQYQGGTGGFYYWKGYTSYEPYPYLSAYAMYGLVMAKKNGYRVDTRTFDNGISYLRTVLSKDDDRYGYGVGYNTKAMILYVLAENSSPDFGMMEQLYSKREKLPLEARAFLLKALVKAKGNSSMIEDLVSEFRNMMKISPTTAHFEEEAQPDWWWCWYSQVKTTAIVAQALIDAQNDDPFASKIVRWIMDQQKSGRWRTTQENMYVAATLSSYFKVYEKDEPKFRAEVKIVGEKVLSEMFEGRTTKQKTSATPIANIPSEPTAIDITKDGPGRLYYTLRMNYFPKEQSMMKEEGFSVSKRVEFLEKENDSVSTIGIGTIARITLTIASNQMRTFVVVDDPLPAGFEIINTSFQTTAQNLDEDEGRHAWYFNHRERKDDRALFFADNLPAGVNEVSYLVRVTSYGTFQMPSTRVEEMYEPEVFGQTASKCVKVK